MKQIVYLIIATLLILGAFSFSSCQKCTTCSYTYMVNDKPITYDYATLCGSNNAVNNYKDQCEAAAAFYSSNCTCIDD